MLILQKAQYRRMLKLIFGNVAALLAGVIGMLFVNHWLIQRASEDAYATALWKQSARTAQRLEQYFENLLAETTKSIADASANGWETLDWPADLLAARIVDEHGEVIEYWLPDTSQARQLPAARLTTNQQARLAEHLPVLDFYPSEANHPALIAMYIPALTNFATNAVLNILLPAEVVVSRCFPSLDEPLISGFALVDRAGRIIIEFSRPEHRGHLRQAQMLRTEPLFTEPERGLDAYRLLEHAGARYLAVVVPAVLCGNTTWLVETAMPYSTVRQAPRALFKSLVIICAWLLPFFGFLLLYTAYRLWHTAETGAQVRQRQELEQVQAHFATLLDTHPAAICLLEPTIPPELSFVSKRVEEITGYAAIELIANPALWHKLVAPEDRERVAQKRQAALQELLPQFTEYQLHTRDGRALAVQEQILPICDNTGKAVRLMAMISCSTAAVAVPILEHATAPTMADGNSTAPRRQILFADDDHLLAHLCAKYLAHAGYGITLAYDGLEAVAHFQARPDMFDLVILDMIMPKMSGIEAVSRLQQIRPDVKIIGISGYSQDGSEWDLFRHNITDFLAKPFQPEELLDLVQKTLKEVPTKS